MPTKKNNNTPTVLDPNMFGIRCYGKNRDTWGIVGPSEKIAEMFRDTETVFTIKTKRGTDMNLMFTGSVVVRKVEGEPRRIWMEDGAKKSAAIYNRITKTKKNAEMFDESIFE